MFSRLIRGVAALSLVAVIGATSAQAAPALTFNIGAAGTTATSDRVSFNGGSSALVGTDINVSSVTGSGGFVGEDPTPQNAAQTLVITGGSLNFTTGGLSSSVDSGIDVDYFAAGGSFEITGGILGTTPDIADGEDLLFAGVFTGITTVSLIPGGLEVLASVNLTQVNETLALHFGLPAGVPYKGAFNLSFATSGTVQAGAAFTSTQIFGGAERVTATPEPATVVSTLIAFPLLGLGAWARKRRKQS